MTTQRKLPAESEELVRRILTETFGQKPSNAQVCMVAEKVRATLPKLEEPAYQ
jgi:hypothetical protein